MPDDHVLRVADQSCNAAEIRTHCQRQEIRRKRQFASHHHGYDERRQHETNCVVNQQSGKGS